MSLEQPSEVKPFGSSDQERFADNLFAIIRLVGAFKRDQACSTSLSVPQALILQEILDGEKEVSALAELAGNTTSAMSRCIDGLERSGFIMRIHDTRDRRRVLIHLTETGQQEARALHSRSTAYVNHLVSLLPEAELDPIAHALARLRSAMELADEHGVVCSEPCSGNEAPP
ncbi:MarR family winged helix-turn-helix transcriptional regulator [Hyalangium sp.]|uniref:MarR family winged helix-turn-helix transcriptional regulator n=1 Tax=Hyalangium sp. TaxID=2028555 RepID=UPI002D584DB7|nr:MarR family winged helix-turn-helix transcriptional regulator [Hyalangium sp.]HYH95623.1 MarR family winged helix-turn-helix transcriptional regulator [Hyalangium sp.]